jgi:hypothetical protein
MIVPTLALMFGSRHCFLFVFQPDNETLAAPNLNVVAVNQALRLGYGLAVVATNQRLKAYEVPVKANGISPVLCHLGFTSKAAALASSLATFNDSNGSLLAQSRQLEFATARLPSKNCMDLRHFGQVGGGVFSAWRAAWPVVKAVMNEAAKRAARKDKSGLSTVGAECRA